MGSLSSESKDRQIIHNRSEQTMSDRINTLDWSTTSVGPMQDWPKSLKATIKTMLGSRYPMVLLWGESLIQIYNDAYTALIGDKHPGALGRSIRETQDESWETIGPMIHHVMSTGISNWVPAQMLAVNRAGYTEETYFSLSYSAVEDDNNIIKGMLCVCSEVTQQVLGERRLRLQRDLASKAGETRSMEKVCIDIATAISDYQLDVPFALLYIQKDNGHLILCGTVGIDQNNKTCRLAVDLKTADDDDCWSLRHALNGRIIQTSNINEFAAITSGPWSEQVTTALTLPIPSSIPNDPLGVLVAGISPNSALDENYKSFYELLAGQVSISLRNALAYEEERKRAEALAAIDRAKTAFFSNVSHEFRTPLTLMLGPLEDIMATSNASLSKTDRNQLTTVYQNALRLLKLVNSLLDFSRIEANRAQASYLPTDLSRITGELASSFESAIEKAKLEFQVICPPLSAFIYLDQEMWEKIILNLLSNALKFTLEGHITLQLKETETHAVLSIADTGVGIPNEELSNIFKRFHRVQTSRSRSHEGTGIGLALVKELVELHGGTIAVESVLNKGTTFTVSIPKGMQHLDKQRISTVKPDISTAIRTETYVNEAALWTGSDTDVTLFTEENNLAASKENDERVLILVVDDNAQMLGYLKRILSSHWKVETAKDGVEAMKFVRRKKPDLILSDVMMPNMNGFELLSEIRKDSELNHLPVILLSARAGQEATVEGLEKGANDYMVKPFFARELIARVGAQLEIKRTRQDNIHLRETQGELKKFKTISDYAFDAFILVRQDGSFAYLNELALKRWGYTAEEAKHIRVPDVDVSFQEEKFNELFAMAQQQIIPPFETTHKSKDGTLFPVQVSMGAITLDGEPHVFAVARDITENKKAENALKDSEKKFRTLAESTPEKVWACNTEGVLTYWNQNMQKYTGLPTNEHKFWISFTHPDDLAITSQIWIKANTKVEPYEVECRFRRYDGQYRWHLTRAVPEKDEAGNLLLWIGTCTDIHNQKLFAEELEKNVHERTLDLEKINNELQQFAYVASHDLQEPVRKIRTFAKLLEKQLQEENEAATGYLEKINYAAERMATLIKDLLNFSKLSDRELSYETVNLNTVFEEVQNDFELLIMQKEARINCSKLPVIEAIPLQMHQLFYNLISNALKFTTPERKPVITITATQLDTEQLKQFPSLNPAVTYYNIAFSDNGIGFKQEYAEQIFTIFQRLNGRQKYTGTGIGLALCKKIVLNHRGDIFAVSAENKGALFTVILPEKHLR